MNMLAQFFIFGKSVSWFFWIAPILFVSGVGMILLLWSGYIKKVLIPKYRGKRVEE